MQPGKYVILCTALNIFYSSLEKIAYSQYHTWKSYITSISPQDQHSIQEYTPFLQTWLTLTCWSDDRSSYKSTIGPFVQELYPEYNWYDSVDYDIDNIQKIQEKEYT